MTSRGKVSSTGYAALCKDCARAGRDGRFEYPSAWLESVVLRGGTRSNRCPVCRQEHTKDIQSMAVPYVELDVIGLVADRTNPTGPLGALGPLPEAHREINRTSDLGKLTVSLGDDHIKDILNGLSGLKRVAVFVAGTGTGKSTFMPFRLLHPPPGVHYRPSDYGRIVVTEPRVLATKSTTSHVAEAMSKSHVGIGSEIGYRSGGKQAFDGATRLLYVTDGVLINWIRDGRLREYGMVVIDEAHERSRNIDLILGLLKAALPRFPNLRVIVTSATMDASFFVDYFGGPDHVYTLEVEGKTWGYGEPLWPNEEINLDHDDWARPGPNGENIRAKTAEHLELRLNTPIDEREWRQRMPTLVADQALKLLKGTQSGDILAFLPGRVAINEAVARINEYASCPVDVYPLLSETSEAIQNKACAARHPGDKRRVVVATNIAETSLTIDGISYVIDSGLINQRVWDPETASGSVPTKPHSRDGVRQRWGRAGRNAPGWVFPLYTREQYKQFSEHTAPESCRDDLEQFYLSALASGINDPENFEWPMSFVREDELDEQVERRNLFLRELNRAGRALRQRGAVDNDGFLTAAGREIERSVGDASEVMALIAADQAGCAVEFRALIAALSGRGLIGDLLHYQRTWSPAWRLAVQRRHLALMAGCIDDLDLVLKLFGGWQAAKGDVSWDVNPKRRQQNFSLHHLLSHDRLKAIEQDIEKNIAPLQIGKRDRSVRNVDPQLAPRLRRVLAATLADRIWVQGETGWRPESDPNWSRPTRVVDRPWLSSLKRVIVWKRRSNSDGAVELDHLIALPEEAETITSAQEYEDKFWALMVGCARELGPKLDDHWLMSRRSLIGGRIRLPEGIITPLADDLFRELKQSDQDEFDDDEFVNAVDEGRSELVNATGARPAISISDEDEDSGVLGVEVNEPTSKQRKGSGEATKALFPLDFAQDQLVTEKGTPLVNGEWEIVGLQGIGANRVAVIQPVVEPNTKPLEECEGRCIYVGPAWSGSRVALFINNHGERLALDSELGLLDQFDQDGLLRIAAGPHVLTVTEEIKPLWMLEGTRLPNLASEFWKLVKSTKSSGGIQATVREVRRDWVRVELNATGVLDGVRLSVKSRRLEDEGIPIAEGSRLLLSDCEVHKKGKSRSFKDPLPERPGTGLSYDPESGVLTITQPPLPVTLYRKLTNLLSSSDELNRLRNLWGDSHRVFIQKVQGLVDDDDLDHIKPAKVIRSDAQGAWLVLAGGVRARLKRDALSVGEKTPISAVFNKGDYVDVSLIRDSNGELEAKVPDALHGIDTDETWIGVVKFVNDSGLVVLTEFGEGWVHVAKITEGFLNESPIDLFSVGQPVVVVVSDINERGPQLELVEACCSDGSWLGGYAAESPDSVDEFINFLDAGENWTNPDTWRKAFPDISLDLWCAVAGISDKENISSRQAIRLLRSQALVEVAILFTTAWDALNQRLDRLDIAFSFNSLDLIREASKQMSGDRLQQWLDEFSGRLEKATAGLDDQLRRVERVHERNEQVLADFQKATEWLGQHEFELASGLKTLKRNQAQALTSLDKLEARVNEARKEVDYLLLPIHAQVSDAHIEVENLLPPIRERVYDAHIEVENLLPPVRKQVSDGHQEVKSLLASIRSDTTALDQRLSNAAQKLVDAATARVMSELGRLRKEVSDGKNMVGNVVTRNAEAAAKIEWLNTLVEQYTASPIITLSYGKFTRTFYGSADIDRNTLGEIITEYEYPRLDGFFLKIRDTGKSLVVSWIIRSPPRIFYALGLLRRPVCTIGGTHLLPGKTYNIKHPATYNLEIFGLHLKLHVDYFERI